MWGVVRLTGSKAVCKLTPVERHACTVSDDLLGDYKMQAMILAENSHNNLAAF